MIISTPLEQITSADIEELCECGSHEGPSLEFKRELPGRNGRPDPWMTGDSHFTPYARDQLFREVVAFANAQGGTLVLGIDESEDNPPRAAKVMPIERVHNLAAQLEDAARACIDPQLGSLRIMGVVTDELTGSGVVLLRTAPSPVGPHRVASDGHAYIRRGTSKVQMTMREIQDLTLDLARGADRLDAIFDQRAAEFSNWLRRSSNRESGGLRVTAVPVSRLPQTIRIANSNLDFVGEFYVSTTGSELQQLSLPIHSYSERPILRGKRWHDDALDFAFKLEVLDNGIIDFWLSHSVEQGTHLVVSWFLATYLRVLELAHSVRNLAEAPDWEYAVEAALDGVRDAGVSPGDVKSLEQINLETLSSRKRISITDIPVRFPRMVTRSRADDVELVNTLYRDLYDGAGIRGTVPRLVLVS